ncbi:thioredoxin domain-containing protein 3 homolog, partial [Schistocerca cancellata]|uniref:thioredoxin domain-containing protein 3 homolog n=1 Tax=Schistocerca cancellata TaxID=274614 RepID=UPI0021180D22
MALFRKKEKKKKKKNPAGVGRRMAGKKGAIVQLQAEINTDEEWDKILAKEGLLVVDVYSEWCGPCLGMVGTLKKLKLEVGGDLLNLAIAKADGIECLKRFRNKSEPTWMFIGSGHLVNLMFGANAPRLSRLIVEELENESKVLRGERERAALPFDELTEEERIRHEAQEKKRLAALAKEQAAQEQARRREERRRMRSLKELLRAVGLVVYLQAADPEACEPRADVLRNLEEAGLQPKEQLSLEVPAEIAEKLWGEEAAAAEGAVRCVVDVVEVPPPGAEEAAEDALEPVVRAVYGETDEGASPDSPAARFPTVWAPRTAHARALAASLLLPELADRLLGPPPPPPPPRAVLVFDAGKAKELADALAEHRELVLRRAYFDASEPDEASRVADTDEDYQAAAAAKPQTDKLVVVVEATRGDAVLALSQFQPCYISPGPEEGAVDAEAWFPPSDDEDDDEE